MPQPSPLTATSLRASHPATIQHLDTTVEPLHSPGNRPRTNTPGSRMFVPPRRPDDPAAFDLWTEGGEFRSLTSDESSWIQKVTQCTSILQTSPFIVLYGVLIKTYRTLGGQPVAYGSDPSPAKRGTIGNPRMGDPMINWVGLDVFTSVALAFLLEGIPVRSNLLSSWGRHC